MISRHFIDVKGDAGTRRVHYRKAGTGPPLLMVHQSPRSSMEYEPLMLQWAEHFTCIAPDTPGFGQSDALAGRPEIGDFADALIDFLDAIGVDQCAAYGFHSGGIILVTTAKKHASRFSVLAVGGYAIWSPEEMALFSDQYLPAFEPAPYGEHLVWLWNRILEQTWFFPWFATEDKYRLSVAHDDPERVDQIIREMLDSGNAYRDGYGAVLRAPRDIPDAGSTAPPCLISTYDGDPLQEHIDRLGPLPANWSAQKVKTPSDHQHASLEFLRKADTPRTTTICENTNEGFFQVNLDGFDGLIHWAGKRGGDLRLHQPGRDSSCLGFQDGLVIDLPGHGLSDSWTSETPTDWPAWRRIIEATAAELDAATIICPDIPNGNPDRLYPDLSPDRFGQYLSIAWQIVRARHFFAPWYEAKADSAVSFDRDEISPEKLAREHLALLNAKAAKAWHLALEQRS